MPVFYDGTHKLVKETWERKKEKKVINFLPPPVFQAHISHTRAYTFWSTLNKIGGNIPEIVNVAYKFVRSRTEILIKFRSTRGQHYQQNLDEIVISPKRKTLISLL